MCNRTSGIWGSILWLPHGTKSEASFGLPRATKSEASFGLPHGTKAKHPLVSPFLRGTEGGSNRGTLTVAGFVNIGVTAVTKHYKIK